MFGPGCRKRQPREAISRRTKPHYASVLDIFRLAILSAVRWKDLTPQNKLANLGFTYTYCPDDQPSQARRYAVDDLEFLSRRNICRKIIKDKLPKAS
jgi:hypothetical protein